MDHAFPVSSVQAYHEARRGWRRLYGEFQFADAVGYRRWLGILIRMSGYKSVFGSVDSDVWKRK